MKRTLLFIACVLASVTMMAQDSQLPDYLPFVETGKQWHVACTDFGDPTLHFDTYTMNEEVVKDGKTYLKMYCHEDLLNVVYDAGLVREEDRKVYLFDTDKQKEFLMFDYSLKAGDTYETYSYEEQKMVSYKVLSVDDYTEGPQVVSYVQEADSMTTKYRYLRKWMVCRTDYNSFQKTWIESVGSIEWPFANFYDVSPVSSRVYLAYVDDFYGNLYLPFSFFDTLNRQAHGCNLPTYAENNMEDDGHHQLTYELEGDRLHVYGKVFTQCGPNNYAYFYEKPTDDPLVHKIEFEIQEAQPTMDCMALRPTNFYVPGFNPNMNYIVVDNQGEEHPVINKTPQNQYRPMIEEGKVWKVGAVNSGNPVQWVEYYYFDGDTIIDGRTCKRMMRQIFVSPDYPYYELVETPSFPLYEGAWYEEDKKVYFYDATTKQLGINCEMMYDFSANSNDTIQINNQRYIIGPRQTGGIKGFKGVYRDITNHMAWKTTWLEGVGSLGSPRTNVYGEGDSACFLMSCTVGDEVIYFNDAYEDGATPDSAGARKGRFDFTHITKIRPKVPMRRAADKPLYGEYNDQLLGINLDPLDDAYLVRITDESGKGIYEKAIDAGNIVGLNIDISTFAKGRYTVTLENSQELFTGEFEAQATGIEENVKIEKIKNEKIYNLQGQRICSLRKGLIIVNGRKVVVR